MNKTQLNCTYLRLGSLLISAILCVSCGGGNEQAVTYAAVAQFVVRGQPVNASIASGRATQAEANAVALSKCGPLCTMKFEITNPPRCLAVAIGNNFQTGNVLKLGSGGDQATAQNDATTQCAIAGGTQCLIWDAVCT